MPAFSFLQGQRKKGLFTLLLPLLLQRAAAKQQQLAPSLDIVGMKEAYKRKAEKGVVPSLSFFFLFLLLRPTTSYSIHHFEKKRGRGGKRCAAAAAVVCSEGEGGEEGKIAHFTHLEALKQSRRSGATCQQQLRSTTTANARTQFPPFHLLCHALFFLFLWTTTGLSLFLSCLYLFWQGIRKKGPMNDIQGKKENGCALDPKQSFVTMSRARESKKSICTSAFAL